MPGEKSRGRLHPAAYYLMRLRLHDQSIRWEYQVLELKDEISAHRLLRFKITDLLARFSLTGADLTGAEFSAQSMELVHGLSQLAEKMGFKLAPNVIPAQADDSQLIALTFKPDLGNDADISYVQALLNTRRELKNRDLIYVQRMQQKLNNYNVMLRVFEGMSAFSLRELNDSQLEYLNELITGLSLPQEGMKYLKTCYTFYSHEPIFRTDFSHPEYFLKPLNAELSARICAYLSELAARHSYRMHFDKRYPLFEKLNDRYQTTAPARAEAPSVPRPTVPKPAAPKPAAPAVKADFEKYLQNRLQAIDLLIRRAQAMQLKLSSAKPRSPAPLLQLIESAAANLKRDSSLSAAEIDWFANCLKRSLNLLQLCPPQQELIYTYGAGGTAAKDSRRLSIITRSAELKKLYPYFMLKSTEEQPAGGFDLLNCFFYEQPFSSDLNGLSEAEVKFHRDAAAMLCAHYLLVRNIFLGYCPSSTDLFSAFCRAQQGGSLNGTNDMYAVCALFYCCYRRQLPEELQPLPEAVFCALLINPQLLALYAKHYLSQAELYLKNLSGRELDAVLIWIYRLIRQSDKVNLSSSLPSFKTLEECELYLPQLKAQLTQLEDDKGAPLFAYSKTPQQPGCLPEADLYDQHPLFLTAQSSELLQLIGRSLLSCPHFGQNVQSFILLQENSGFELLLHNLTEQYATVSYFRRTGSAILPEVLAAIISPQQHSELLNRVFCRNKLQTLTKVLMFFNMPDRRQSIGVFSYILKRAGVLCLPHNPFLFGDLCGTEIKVEFIDFPLGLKPKEEREFRYKLISGQIALHFYSTVNPNFSGAPEQVLLHALDLKTPAQKAAALRCFAAMKDVLQSNPQLAAPAIKRCYSSFSGRPLYEKALKLLQELIRQDLARSAAGAASLRRYESLFAAAGLPKRALIELSMPARPVFRGFDHLDAKLIHSKLKETSEVLSVIGTIRDNAEEGSPAGANEPAAKAPPAPEPAPEPAAAPETEPEAAAADSTPAGLFASLDEKSAELLHAIRTQQSEVMDLNEFSGLCLSARFMSSSVAVEMLNEFAYEHFDEPLFDVAPEENSVYITVELLEKLLPEP